MQLGRGGECHKLACNKKPQQPLIGMIINSADPRYAGRLDDKQGGNTIVVMERDKETSTFRVNAELADESTWL